MSSDTSTGFRVGAPNADVRARRNNQLEKWTHSDTNKVQITDERGSSIQFQRKFMFLDSVAQQDIDEVTKLLSLGVDVNHTNPDGISALHQVAIDGNEEIAAILLQHSPLLNAPDNDGWTPLHAAAQCGFTGLARMLLEAGADVTCIDNEGELPIDKAEEHDMRDLLSSWMREQGVNLDEVRTAEERALRDACDKAARSRSRDLPHVTVDGATILHCAAVQGLDDCIAKLAKAGISMNIQDNDGWTSLHAAAHWGQERSIVSLIENGADIHIVNTFAETPLDVCCEEVIDLLKDYYDRAPSSRSRSIQVPGVEKFLNPYLPDRGNIQPIIKGSRKIRENKENRPDKIIPNEDTVPTKIPAKDKADAQPVSNRVRDNAGPSVLIKRPQPENETPTKKRAENETPTKKPEKTTMLSPTDESGSKAAEVVRKQVSRRKREERRPTQHVNLEDIEASVKTDDKKKEQTPVKDTNQTPKTVNSNINNNNTSKNNSSNNNSNNIDSDKKNRNALPTVQITDSGALAWDAKKSPESDNSPSHVPESASNKAEVVRKKVARKKRDERRATQHVNLDDLPGNDSTPNNNNNNTTVVNEDKSKQPTANDLKEKEDHLKKELELERIRYEESVAALTRNQEDLRKREIKIASLEKDNDSMKRKIAELEEELRSLNQVRNDNQRLRDENAALIRVIGKLSRNPL